MIGVQNNLFHLQTAEMSYAFGVAADGKLVHLYWGKRLDTASLQPLAAEMLAPIPAQQGVGDLPRRFELPTREPFDYGDPALWVRHADGSRGLRLIYASHEMGENELTVIMKDEAEPVTVKLHYKLWGDLPLVSRWLTIENNGSAALDLQAIRSAAWYVPDGCEYRLTHLSGQWGCEYTRNELMLTQARTVLQNSRITCAAHQQTPFFALDLDGASTELAGEVFFGVLHWSGDFDITVEQQMGKRTSVTGGIGTFDSGYSLKPGEAFTAPMFTGGFSPRGFERMSEVFYDWQYDYLLPRGKTFDKAHAERPVIYNSWYPYEFDVNEENCLAMVEKCAPLGVELFVIDDGWMPKRTAAKAGLGDWVADPERFPHGLQAISKACHDKGMLFGLWVEPEMVNPDSDLYREHPDWVIGDTKRGHTFQRNQLVLDLSRDDVLEWAIAMLDRVIEEYQLDYLKWDMNRYVTENAGAPELPIRYTQNLLKIWRHMNEKYPDLLLENCASGGGRSDFGMVPYADRINRSDNADPVDVMILHEGFTMLFVPKTAGGAGNIAPAMHHIHKRSTPFAFRAHWGMTGSMSIGINILKSTQEELDEIRDTVARFKTLRGDLQHAYVYRIASARKNPYAVFEYVRRDREAFTLFAFAHGMRCWDLPMPRFRMRGLIPDAVYQDEQGLQMTGEALMHIGLMVRLKGDCDSKMWVWKKVK